MEILWILSWSLIGGILAKGSHSLQRFLIKGGIAIAILWGSCWIILSLQAGWMPLVPAVLGVAIAGVCVIFIFRNRL